MLRAPPSHTRGRTRLNLYLDYLSAKVPPRRLLSSAARRAWRSARIRLGTRPASPSCDETLAAMGCASPAALAQRLASPGRGLVAQERAGLAAALARFFPGEAARALGRAERAAAGRLTVFGRELDVARSGGGTDWQLDALPGGRSARWAPSVALPEAPGAGIREAPGADISRAPGADIKVAWAVGRGDQWVALGCGAAAAAEPSLAGRFAEAYAASLRDFVARNPAGQGAHWASPMEAALRAVCLGQAHALMTGQPALADGGYALDLVRLAVATGRFVLAHLEDGQVVPNNHLAADWVGLLACAVLVPEWPEAARWRALATAGLVRELEAQTHEDGTSFEGSIPYQRLAVEIFTAGALLARLGRAPLGGSAWRRLSRLYASTRALLARDGQLPQIGDHDSGRVFAFRERTALDAGYLLPLAAAVTGDPTLLVRPGAIGGEEALWLCGPAVLDRLYRARPGPPPVSASFPAGGFHVLRRGSLEVTISCGRNGQGGIGGHSHNDKLAFELRLGGRLVVCDPGSPCYLSDPGLRDRFRATRAHATICLDGEEQAPIPPARPFALPDAADARCTAFESSRRRERFVGEHHGYARLGIVHRRELLVLEDTLVVADRLSGAGTHGVELRFPFPSPDARLRPVAEGERRRLERLGDGTAALFALAQACEVGPAGAPLCALVVASPLPLETRLDDAAYSPGYAQLVPSRTAVWAGRIPCPATLVTVILPLAGAAASSNEE